MQQVSQRMDRNLSQAVSCYRYRPLEAFSSLFHPLTGFSILKPLNRHVKLPVALCGVMKQNKISYFRLFKDIASKLFQFS